MHNYIPHYNLLRQLDSGSMGEVWLAEHASNGRRAAVKFLRSELISDSGDLSPADVQELFLRECQVLASFDHPNIVRIYDNARVGDTPYMVMELLAGGTLAERIRQGPLSVGEAIGIVVQVANALGTVHSQQVIHRDLKPANIMLRDEVTPVLTDFGLVRLLQPGKGTVIGKLMAGTLNYMSPEQFQRQPASVSTDLYALGVIFHELLTGRIPYVRTHFEAIPRSAMPPPPPLPREWSSLQPVLDQLLAEEPRRRYATAQQFITALRHTFVTDPNLAHLIGYSGLGSAWFERLHSLGFAVLKPGHAYSPPPPPLPASSVAPAPIVSPVAEEVVKVADVPVSERRPSIPRKNNAARIAIYIAAAAAILSVLGAVYLTRGTSAVTSSGMFQDALKSGSLAPEMVRIEGGRIQMGSDRIAIARPVREVTISDFAIGRTEVTVGQFKAFVTGSGYRTDAERNVGSAGCFTIRSRGVGFAQEAGANWNSPGFAQSDTHPAVCLSKEDAEAYVAWLSVETGAQYRLPSEAQLEYLSRGKDESGVAICAYANVAISPTQRCAATLGTVPTGSLREDSHGLFDIAGNASEWTADCWSNSYVGAPATGDARTDGDCTRGVLRGGGWFRTKLDPADRTMSNRTDRTFETGFRVVRDLK